METAVGIRTAMHISTCFGIQLNIYGAYLISKRSNKEMGLYRYCLSLILFSAVLFDFGVTTGAQLDPLLPYYGGAFASWINIFHKLRDDPRQERLGAIVYLVLCLDAGLMGSALAISFLFRAYVLAKSETQIWIKRFFYGFLVYLGLMIPILSFVIFNGYVTGDALEDFKAKHPEILPKIDDRPFFLFDIGNNTVAAVMLGLLVFFFLFVGGISICCTIFVFRRLHKLRGSMTEKTRKQHQMYLVALMVHSSAPLLFFYLPFIIAFGSILSQDLNSAVLGDIAMFLIPLHSSANVFILVIFMTPYRRATLDYIGMIFPSLARFRNTRNNLVAAATSTDFSSRQVEPLQRHDH